MFKGSVSSGVKQYWSKNLQPLKNNECINVFNICMFGYYNNNNTPVWTHAMVILSRRWPALELPLLTSITYSFHDTSLYLRGCAASTIREGAEMTSSPRGFLKKMSENRDVVEFNATRCCTLWYRPLLHILISIHTHPPQQLMLTSNLKESPQ